MSGRECFARASTWGRVQRERWRRLARVLMIMLMNLPLPHRWAHVEDLVVLPLANLRVAS